MPFVRLSPKSQALGPSRRDLQASRCLLQLVASTRRQDGTREPRSQGVSMPFATGSGVTCTSWRRRRAAEISRRLDAFVSDAQGGSGGKHPPVEISRRLDAFCEQKSTTLRDVMPRSQGVPMPFVGRPAPSVQVGFGQPRSPGVPMPFLRHVLVSRPPSPVFNGNVPFACRDLKASRYLLGSVHSRSRRDLQASRCLL
jgi:hypothetical protein